MLGKHSYHLSHTLNPWTEFFGESLTKEESDYQNPYKSVHFYQSFFGRINYILIPNYWVRIYYSFAWNQMRMGVFCRKVKLIHSFSWNAHKLWVRFFFSDMLAETKGVKKNAWILVVQFSGNGFIYLVIFIYLFIWDCFNYVAQAGLELDLPTLASQVLGLQVMPHLDWKVGLNFNSLVQWKTC
jgi:hypothetical protein